jgi:sec-independent protein translocase protein TatB
VLNLDPSKLLIIAVVAVILLGPDKLPQVARQVGAAWRTFGEFRHRMESEVRSSIPDLPSSTEIARLARSPSALLNHLSTLAPDRADRADGPDGAERPPTSADVAGNESDVTGSAVPAASTTPTSVPPTPTTRPPTQTPASRRAEVGVPGDPSLN